MCFTEAEGRGWERLDGSLGEDALGKGCACRVCLPVVPAWLTGLVGGKKDVAWVVADYRPACHRRPASSSVTGQALSRDAVLSKRAQVDSIVPLISDNSLAGADCLTCKDRQMELSWKVAVAKSMVSLRYTRCPPSCTDPSANSPSQYSSNREFGKHAPSIEAVDAFPAQRGFQRE